MKKKRSRKNRFLITTTRLSVLGFILAACFADSESIIPIIVMVVCLLWMLIMLIANRDNRRYVVR